MGSFDDFIAGASLPTATVPLCVAGDLQAEWEDLERDLQDAVRSAGDSLAAGGAPRRIAEQMEALREKMRQHERTVKFRALSRRAYRDLVLQHPPRDDDAIDQAQMLNMDTFPVAVIAACAVEPVMTVEQVGQLEDRLTDWQFNELFAACMLVNRTEVSVPKSVTASEILASIAPNSKPPAPGGSQDGGSSAGSLAG